MNLIVIVPFPFVKLINIDSQAGLNVSLELDDQQARYSHQTFHLVKEKKGSKTHIKGILLHNLAYFFQGKDPNNII